MLRRNTRLRKEYLYRKSLEGKEKVSYENKRKIRKALAEGKPIPRELLDIEESLRHEIELEDESRKVPKFDDEYENAGVSDPKIFITASRDPSSRLVIFAKELASIIPNCQKMNRGTHQIGELIEACRVNQVTDFIIVTETHGDPNGMIISHLPYGPTAYFSLSSVVMRHDVQVSASLPKVYPKQWYQRRVRGSNEKRQTKQTTQTILIQDVEKEHKAQKGVPLSQVTRGEGEGIL
eukprot:TRINITY_DN3011_c0_g2_i1.p2 TRINITY_DN3011_c0_g2~~TRINITY_DN3011_c0_g2_i1.p2  ORF type:complete len:236 (-),score=41.36 TRINITY_DN3011_c0_g2_i1:823-1530(-)